MNIGFSSKLDRPSNKKVFSVFALLCVLSAMCELPLIGRLFVSHLFELMLFGYLIAQNRGKMNRYAYLFVLIISGQILLAYLYALVTKGEMPKFDQFIFFTSAMWFVFAASTFLETPADALEFCRKFEWYCVYLGLPYFIALFVFETGSDILFRSYGFNDKSHAAVLLGLLAIVALLSKKKLLSAIFIILSTTTSSRLSILYFAGWLLILLFQLFSEKHSSRKLLFGLAVVAGLVFGVGAILDEADVVRTLLVFDRLSADNTGTSQSNQAHTLIALLALGVKFDNVSNFLFGCGPGLFGAYIDVAGVTASQLKAVDPPAYMAIIAADAAPVHSVPLSILTEFPIMLFVSYLVFVITMVWRSFRSMTLLIAFSTVMAGSLFYSTHNHFFFWVMVFYLFQYSRTLKINKVAGVNLGPQIDSMRAI